jgi:hypothetical protein
MKAEYSIYSPPLPIINNTLYLRNTATREEQGFSILSSVLPYSRSFATPAGEEVLVRPAKLAAPAPLPLRANRKQFARSRRMEKPSLEETSSVLAGLPAHCSFLQEISVYLS